MTKTPELRLIQRAVEGGYVKADVTGAGEWHIGRITKFDKTHIEFISEIDGEKVRIARTKAYKATEQEYKAVAEGEEDEADLDGEDEVDEDDIGDDVGLEDQVDVTEEDEAEFAGSVVKAGYRVLYRERGNPDNCGDWLASKLDGRFDDGKGGFDHQAFTDMLVENGVELSGNWTLIPSKGGRGWQGRYRMNGRQRLQVILARTGKLILDGSAIKVPAEALAKLRAKHGSE